MNRIRRSRSTARALVRLHSTRHDLSGTLARLVEEDGLAGVTSNPAIFESNHGKRRLRGGARGVDSQRSERIRGARFSRRRRHSMGRRRVASRLRANARSRRFRQHRGPPHLAYDTTETIEEGLRLFEAVGRDNLMVKVPATPEGIPAIERLIGSGVNVNVTLLFRSRPTKKSPRRTWRASRARRLRQESRDGGVGRELLREPHRHGDRQDPDERLATASSSEVREKIEATRSEVAIANAKLAYRAFADLIGSPRWKKLEERGARPQRLLWASTSAKNPKLRDVRWSKSSSDRTL